MPIRSDRPDTPWLCFVCGLDYRGIDEFPWGPDGDSPTYNYCVCCGVEFGYGDFSLVAVRNWRDRWLGAGARWFKELHRPEDWDAHRQMQQLPERARRTDLDDDELSKVREVVETASEKGGPDECSLTCRFSAFGESGSPPPNELIQGLRALGCEVIADEELSGDGFWHVAAFREVTPLEPLIIETVAQMASLAERTCSTFNGWAFGDDGT